MTIALNYQDFSELFQEADKEELNLDVLDELDVTWQRQGRLGQGLDRRIQLREGIFLRISKRQPGEPFLLNFAEHKRPLKWHFFLSGNMQKTFVSPAGKETCLPHSAGQYSFSGSGLTKRLIDDCTDTEPAFDVVIDVQPDVLRSFVSDSSGELPQLFNHLVLPHEACYKRVGETPPMVNTILHQIIQCPYQGLTKRIYLESKATEIMALMLEEEAAIQQGEFQRATLQRDRLDRIHHAKEILLKDLKKSPTLETLADQVGMCEYSLKRDFKEVFGTTVYGYLRDRRMEKAQQLLLDGQLKVATVARAVGYDSPTSFNAAFKRKFGASPKAYQISVRR
ncbi:MAG: AraC family transcriptional regulator [Cyanobacteria bacterium P01_H01_bin.58]